MFDQPPSPSLHSSPSSSRQSWATVVANGTFRMDRERDMWQNPSLGGSTGRDIEVVSPVDVPDESATAFPTGLLDLVSSSPEVTPDSSRVESRIIRQAVRGQRNYQRRPPLEGFTPHRNRLPWQQAPIFSTK